MPADLNGLSPRGPHSHEIRYDAQSGGRIDYGDQHEYLHLMTDTTPWWWPRWYLNWKTKRVVRRLIARHDEQSQPPEPVTPTGAVRVLIAQAQAGLEARHGK